MPRSRRGGERIKAADEIRPGAPVHDDHVERSTTDCGYQGRHRVSPAQRLPSMGDPGFSGMIVVCATARNSPRCTPRFKAFTSIWTFACAVWVIAASEACAPPTKEARLWYRPRRRHGGKRRVGTVCRSRVCKCYSASCSLALAANSTGDSRSAELRRRDPIRRRSPASPA